MGLLLAVSGIYVPQFLRKRRLEFLFDATAGAFQVPAPSSVGLSYSDYLALYAEFTRDQAGRVLRLGDGEEVRSRLFNGACRIGQQLRIEFNIRTFEEVMRVGSLTYKLLKIDLRGDRQGDIMIKQCFFSAYYSSQVCRLISALDEGLFAGLSWGGRLSFSQRITEGSQCCRAFLAVPGRSG
jgi:hypothetical protein